MTARIDSMAWLTPSIAMLVGSADIDVSSEGVAWLNGEQVKASSCRLMTPAGSKFLLTLHTGVRPSPGQRLGRFSINVKGAELKFEPPELSDVVVDLQTMVRLALAPLPAGARTELLEFLAATQTNHAAAAGASLTHSLVALREALRERLVPCVIGRDEAIGLAVECILAIDTRRFFIQGWFRDAEAPVTSLRVVSPEGSTVELLDDIYRFQRPDLERLYGVPSGDQMAGTGFACSFELGSPSTAPTGWIVELRNALGSAVESVAPRVVTSKDEVRTLLLSDIGLERPGEESLTLMHLHPAITSLQQQNAERMRIERVVQFGDPPANPQLSMIVPLYRRIDFLQHQLAQFSLDPELSDCDLIYVLDSPEHGRDLLAFASALVDLYRVPFRVAILGQNVGFAGANLAGASIARGRLLLFMNSDVLPERPGWLAAMSAFYDSHPGIGALGPKLLFEDDSIQHAGLFFRRPPNSTFWENDHYFKGLYRDVPPASISRPVPAVTAACMMVDRALFDEVGGFSGSYVRGDYEDSEFCLRAIKAGRTNWYLADVALYHLEGQSYESSGRQYTSRYNAWLHTHLWGDEIADVMREFETGVPASSSPAVIALGDFVQVALKNRAVVDDVEAR